MKGPWILLIAGGVFLALSAGVVVVSLLLVALSGGRTDLEEAMLGIVPGSCCSLLSLVMVVGGVIWLALAGKKR
ncbi:MAG: hypothetical protein SFU86_10340 [Pirellulaceae bacterium]|nr:hypothetical protein [Pirellulaceae bacterium]